MWQDWDSALTAEFANCFEAFLRFITHDHSCSRRTFFRTVYNVSLASTRALPAPGVCVVFIKYILIKFSPFPSLLRSSSTPIYITPLPPCSVNVSPSLPSFKKKSSKQKPIRQKKKCQNRTRWKRSYTQKIKRKRTWIHGIYFALANCFWLWGLPWSMADTHSNTSWRKLIFTFPEADTCKQLLGWGWTHAHIPLPVLGPCLVWMCTGTVHAATVSVTSSVHQSHCFLEVTTTSGSYSVTASSSA